MLSTRLKQVNDWVKTLPEVELRDKTYSPNNPNWIGSVKGWVGDISNHLEDIIREVTVLEMKMAKLRHVMDDE